MGQHLKVVDLSLDNLLVLLVGLVCQVAANVLGEVQLEVTDLPDQQVCRDLRAVDNGQADRVHEDDRFDGQRLVKLDKHVRPLLLRDDDDDLLVHLEWFAASLRRKIPKDKSKQ